MYEITVSEFRPSAANTQVLVRVENELLEGLDLPTPAPSYDDLNLAQYAAWAIVNRFPGRFLVTVHMLPTKRTPNGTPIWWTSGIKEGWAR